MKKIYVKKGQIFDIRLPENITTGYRWELYTSPELEVIDSRINQPKANLLGSSRDRYWTIKALREGLYKVEGYYSRSWEKQPEYPDYTLSVDVS